MDHSRPVARLALRPALAQAAITALLYFITAWASIALATQPPGVAAVWPPSGLLLAILVLTAPATWPLTVAGVAVAITLANLSAGASPLVSLGFAAANCAESLLAAVLLRRANAGSPPTMASLRDVVLLFVVAVVVSCAATALLGAAVAALAYGSPFWEAWRVWWVADGLGILIVGAAILSWAAPVRGAYLPPGPLAVAEGLLLLAALTVLAVITFGAAPGPLIGSSHYLTFPLLLWAAARFGPSGASLATLLLASIAVPLTVQGRGPFATLGADSALPVIEVQVFLLVTALSTLALAALTAERRDAQRAVERANAELGRKVAERTSDLAAANARLSDEIRERERAAEIARSLQLVATALSAAPTPRDVARVVAEQGVRALGATGGGVVIRAADDPQQLELIGAAGYGEAVVGAWQRFPLAAAVPLSEAVREGAAVWVESSDELLRRYPALTRTPTSNGSFAAVPLVAHGQILGALSLSFRLPRNFGEDDRRAVGAMADMCAQALERAQLYEAAEAARAAAEAALKLREQFLSIASHELKTPLTALLGNAQLLQRRLERRGVANESEGRNLTAIVAQAARLDRLVAMLLDVTRIESGRLSLNLAPVDLGGLVRRLVDELRPTTASHRFIVEGPAGGPVVLGDDLRLEQVVLNLLQNAVKYSPAGGDVHVALTADAAFAHLSVCDSGIGIPAADLPQLFGRFYRAGNTDRENIAGMGLGLYVVREIVELHGGSVEAISEEGRGARFTVRLPVA
jgi:signal transduction histidine kinase/integral membrane sensor domain MASE1